jgi:hypothetical protein
LFGHREFIEMRGDDERAISQSDDKGPGERERGAVGGLDLEACERVTIEEFEVAAADGGEQLEGDGLA